jgi:hypothetical protein
MSFTGTKVYGNGFVLSVEEAEEILAKDSMYKAVVKPYLVGRELNEAKCVPGRFIIDLTDMDREAAQAYPLVWKIVEQRVREERATAPEHSMREKYWQFQRPRRELYALLRLRGSAWLIAATSDTVAFVAVEYSEDRPVVFSHAVNVLTLDGFGHFAVVQSSLHLCWARRYGSSMKGDLRYTTTDCFETFPFPNGCDSLEEIGRRYYSHRAAVAHDQAIGLTDVYHLMHGDCDSSSISKLRSLHVEMDRAVAAAYGWNDLDLSHDFHDTKQGRRFTISEAARREVLQRLLKLNHECYAEEVKQGLHDKASSKKVPAEAKPKKPLPKAVVPAQTSFDFDEDTSTHVTTLTERETALCAFVVEVLRVAAGLKWNDYLPFLSLATLARVNSLVPSTHTEAYKSLRAKVPKDLKRPITIEEFDALRTTMKNQELIQSVQSDPSEVESGPKAAGFRGPIPVNDPVSAFARLISGICLVGKELRPSVRTEAEVAETTENEDHVESFGAEHDHTH